MREIPARFIECGGFIAINRQFQQLADAAGKAAGKQGTFLETDTPYRDQWHHIRCTNAWMLALLCIHINEPGRCLNPTKCPFQHGIGLPGEGNDAAIVVFIAGLVQDCQAIDRRNGLYNGLDDFQALALRKIWDARNNLFQ